MKEHDACEYAYKNGYSDGVKAAANKIAEELPKMFPGWQNGIMIKARIQEIISEVGKK